MPFIGTQPEVGGYSVLDNLTASATASYTLQKDSANFTPSSANQLLVSLNGVIQKPGTSFTISGSTLTFSSALDSSDSIDFILAMGEPLLVGTPSDGTVNTSQLANDAVTSAKIDSTSTGMTLADLTVNSNIVLDNEDTTLSGGEVLGKIEFKDNDGGSAAAGITSKMESLAVGDFGASALTFHTSTSGGGARTALTERFRIQHNGGVTFNGDTADANALDDYEEGTFTATLVATGSTFQYTYRTGSYTKIGNCVNFNLYIQLDGGGNSFLGNAVTITGLPFTSNSAANNNFRYYVHGRYLNVDGSNYYYVTANLSNGSATLSLNQAGDNVPNKALPATYLSSSSGQMFINGWYHI